MNDYPNTFKKIVGHYLAESSFSIKYEDYYRNEFTRQALLFSICLNELCGQTEAYSNEDIDKLLLFLEKFENTKSTHVDDIECINFLESRIGSYRN